MIVGDIGTVVELTILDSTGAAFNASGATTKQILLRKPTGVVLTKTASFTTDGTDGKIRYTLASGDIDVPGPWAIRGRVASGSYDYSTYWIREEVFS